MKNHIFNLSILFILILSACKKDIPGTNSAQNLESSRPSDTDLIKLQTPNEGFVAHDLLVKFKKGTTEASKLSLLSKIEGKISEKILTKMMLKIGDNEGVYLINTPLPAIEAITKAKGLTGVEYAEPNYVYTHNAVSNDSYFMNGSLWGMYGDASSPSNQYGSQAAEAWARGSTGSSGVVIGIIDEGIQYTHPDLTANCWTNSFDPVDGIDNDNNGYIDDFRGWDFAGNDNTTFDGTQDDHGTHVAGTIGASGGNGTGVAGVNWSIKMISAKFLGRNGGTTANAIKALDYISDLKIRHGINIVATNNSWGGGGFSQSLQDAIERSNQANIMFIAAAGNGGRDGIGDNNDATANYPSNYTNANVLAVAAITSGGAKSSFSNYGAATVDIGAPGSGIYSTVPGKNSSSFSYASFSGTSMATPHVSGAAALYASVNPGSSAATIKSAILGSALPTASLTGKCVTGGRLNVSGF